jgi:hypothetical protein
VIKKEIEASLWKDNDYNLEKRKKLYNKIIKIWEETPEIFKKQDRSYKTDAVYDCSTPNLMGDRNYMNGFVTGCGGNTYYSKEWYQNKLDNWDEVVKEVTSTINYCVKSWMKDLVKDEIEIKYSKLEETVELEGVSKKPAKPKLDFTIDGDTLNSILSETGGEFDVDDEFIKSIEDEYEDEIVNEFKKIKGATFSSEHEGYHHNDGQICDYTVTITTKDNHDYHAYDSHCLMVGWRFDGQITFQ